MIPVHLRFLDEAEADLDHAAGYYELDTKGRGQRFLAEAREAVRYALERPHAGRKEQHRGLTRIVRAYRVGKYPYDLLTTLQDDTMIVVAIKAQRKKPGYWLRRLKHV